MDLGFDLGVCVYVGSHSPQACNFVLCCMSSTTMQPILAYTLNARP